MKPNSLILQQHAKNVVYKELGRKLPVLKLILHDVPKLEKEGQEGKGRLLLESWSFRAC